MTDLFNIHPAIIFAIVTVCSLLIFIAIWFLLNKFYSRASKRWPFLYQFIEKTRKKGETPLVKKYGLVGLALLIAIPLPTIGVYGGTLLSWLMGMKWRSSLIAVVSGATVSNSFVLLSVLGIMQVVGPGS
ncbi:MAG: small multi-drug export protein [Dehalococcoidales bacterium]|nr:MAG: small multi-drug export protein [Dehalococcoidales bacterium]